jgi:hypothetical protein
MDMTHDQPFSICRGGRFHEALSRAGIAGGAVGVAVVLGLGWLPLLVLAWTEGTLIGGVDHPFLQDLGPSIRFFLAAPIAVFAERNSDRLLGIIVDCFRRAGLVREAELPTFEIAVDRVQRRATSDSAELILLVLALSIPHLVVNAGPQFLSGAAWFGTAVNGELQTTWAGRWYTWVSIPLVEFLFLRWLWRIAVWWGFLRQVSKLELALTPAHPDGAAGLGFLGFSPRAFLPILIGVSMMGATGISNQIQLADMSLTDARAPIIALVLCECLILLVPQFFFLPALAKARNAAIINYGLAGTTMAREFAEHWIGSGKGKGADLLESSESSTMIDYAGTYTLVHAMRPTGMSIRQLVGLALPLAAPFAPLLLYEYSIKDILKQVLQIVR